MTVATLLLNAELVGLIRTSYVPWTSPVTEVPVQFAHSVNVGEVLRYSIADETPVIVPLLLLEVVQFVLPTVGAAGRAGIDRLCGMLSEVVVPFPVFMMLTVAPNHEGSIARVVVPEESVTEVPLNL